MPKTQTKKKAGKMKRQTTLNKAKKKSNKIAPTVKAKHVRDTCSITDPFCIHARANRRPDGMSNGTIPYQVRGVIDVKTDANGNALVCILPLWGKYAYTKATYTNPNGPWTLDAAWSTSAQSAFVAANAAEIRLLSGGAIFRNTASMTNCQGLLHSFVVTNLLTGGTMPFLSTNNVEDATTPMTSGLQVTLISKPVGNGAHNFVTNTGIGGTSSDFNWSILCFEVAGGVTGTVVGVIEYVFNIEFQLNQNGVSATGLGPAVVGQRPANPVAIAAQSTVHSSIPSIIEGGLEKAGKKIEKAASSAVESLFDSVAGFGLGLLGL